MEARMDKMRGMLIGVAYGDALGAPCEFNGMGPNVPNRITDQWFLEKRNQYNFRVRLQPGQVTDDTEMTIALMHALKSGHGKIAALREYHAFVNSGTYMLGTNTKALLHGYKSIKLYDKRFATRFSSRKAIDNAQSNGHLMRASPLSLVDDSNTRKALTQLDTLLTNPSAMAQRISVIYVNMLHECLAFCNVEECKAFLRKRCDEHVHEFEAVDGNVRQCFVDALNVVFERDVQTQRGWNLHSLSLSLWTAMNAKSFHEGILFVIQCGGDTDTNASICGALLGAIHGEQIMCADSDTQHNITYIFNVCNPKIESGNGSFDKCLVRQEKYHPQKLFALLDPVRNAKFHCDVLRREVDRLNAQIQSSLKRSKDGKMIAILGASRAGKTTLCRIVSSIFKTRGYRCAIVSQDHFRKVSDGTVEDKKSWETRDGVDWKKLQEMAFQARDSSDVCLVEGAWLLHADDEFVESFDAIVYLESSIDICKSRRTSYPTTERYGLRGWDDANQYVEKCVWPHHLEHDKLVSNRDALKLPMHNTQKENAEIMCQQIMQHDMS